MQVKGVITKGVGGLYTVRPDNDNGEGALLCRARGVFRHEDISPTVGDRVTVVLGPDAVKAAEEAAKGSEKGADGYRKGNKGKKNESKNVEIDGVIDSIDERKNILIRPPMANLDVIFAIIPTVRPAPDLFAVDKLISIAEHADIEPAVIITKCELDREFVIKAKSIYDRAGYRVFPVSSVTGEGVEALSEYISSLGKGAITAFAGASGAGKSTLLNKLYPDLSLKTGELSHKIERGKQTTRHVELFDAGGAYIADTPGFSLLDFERFDFFSCEALPFTFREFEPYHGKCKYTKCAHIKEDGCAIIAAVEEGIVPAERHESYRELYAVLKNKHPWDK